MILTLCLTLQYRQQLAPLELRESCYIYAITGRYTDVI